MLGGQQSNAEDADFYSITLQHSRQSFASRECLRFSADSGRREGGGLRSRNSGRGGRRLRLPGPAGDAGGSRRRRRCRCPAGHSPVVLHAAQLAAGGEPGSEPNGLSKACVDSISSACAVLELLALHEPAARRQLTRSWKLASAVLCAAVPPKELQRLLPSLGLVSAELWHPERRAAQREEEAAASEANAARRADSKARRRRADAAMEALLKVGLCFISSCKSTLQNE